jgi:hypothetical protein
MNSLITSAVGKIAVYAARGNKLIDTIETLEKATRPDHFAIAEAKRQLNGSCPFVSQFFKSGDKHYIYTDDETVLATLLHLDEHEKPGTVYVSYKSRQGWPVSEYISLIKGFEELDVFNK